MMRNRCRKQMSREAFTTKMRLNEVLIGKIESYGHNWENKLTDVKTENYQQNWDINKMRNANRDWDTSIENGKKISLNIEYGHLFNWALKESKPLKGVQKPHPSKTTLIWLTNLQKERSDATSIF